MKVEIEALRAKLEIEHAERESLERRRAGEAEKSGAR